MSQKRQPDVAKEGSDENFAGEKRQKLPALCGIISQVIKEDNFNKFKRALEPLIRRVVKEEVELALASHFRNFAREIEKDETLFPSPSPSPSPSRTLQLKFTNKPSLPIFTGAKIDAQNSSPLTISLIDSKSGNKITNGPESSLKIEIVVLEGDFDEANEEDEFKNFIVREREGRKQLLNGDAFIELKCGLGFITDLSFTDNSSWTRSRRFRLGARSEHGFLNGFRVREAVTEPFMVKDHRGELYKKHHPPYLEDEVWRLEKIGKEGAFHKRLNKEKIITVKDFLTLLHIHPTKLRNILGNGMSTKMWETVADHARTCVLTDLVHVYRINGPIRSGLVFNVVGEIKGVISEQGVFLPIENLAEKQYAEAHANAEIAYKNWDEVETFNNVNLIGRENDNPFVNLTNQFNRFGPIHSPDIFTLGGGMRETSLLDECTSNAYYDANCLPSPYMDSNFLVDTSDLGAALRGFLESPLEMSHAKGYKVGWRTVSLVWGWIFYIKKTVAKKKKGKERLY